MEQHRTKPNIKPVEFPSQRNDKQASCNMLNTLIATIIHYRHLVECISPPRQDNSRFPPKSPGLLPTILTIFPVSFIKFCLQLTCRDIRKMSLYTLSGNGKESWKMIHGRIWILPKSQSTCPKHISILPVPNFSRNFAHIQTDTHAQTDSNKT